MKMLAVSLLLAPSLAYTSPVAYRQLASASLDDLDQALLVTDEYVLYRNAVAQDKDFRDLYWVNLEDSRFDRFTIEQLGTVEAFVPAAFAVLNIPPAKLQDVASVLHDDRWACGQLFRLTGDEIPFPLVPRKASPFIPTQERLPEVPLIQAKVDPEQIAAWVLEISSLDTRYARSSDAGRISDWLLKSYRTLAYNREDVTVQLIQHAESPRQASLVVRIEGQSRPEEIVVLGSHIDSIARGSERAPGADDNASGTASHMEVFRTLIEQGVRFERTVEIHGYAAEELGLIGSQDIANRYRQQGIQVVAMLQNDMNLYRGAAMDMVWLVTNDTDPQLTADLEQLLRQYQTVAFNKARLTAGTSDHRAWHRLGIPAAFPTENPSNFNRRIHTPQDVIEQSGAFSQAAEFVKLSLSFLAHYAGLVETGTRD